MPLRNLEAADHLKMILEVLSHTGEIMIDSNAGAAPNTGVAVVTELFRDWKSPVADKGRELLKWYLAEVQKQTTAVQRTAQA